MHVLSAHLGVDCGRALVHCRHRLEGLGRSGNQCGHVADVGVHGRQDVRFPLVVDTRVRIYQRQWREAA